MTERSFLIAAYRAVIRLFPAATRECFGEDMLEAADLEWQLRRSRRGLWAWPGMIWWLTKDIVVSLPAAYLRQLRRAVGRCREESWTPTYDVNRTRQSWGRGGAMDWIRQIKMAGRSLWRQRGFATIAILTLALGIGANTAIFSVIDGALLRPLPYDDPDGLVRLSDGHEAFGGTGINQSIPNLLDLHAGSRLLDDVAIYSFASGNLATQERPERVRIMRTSHEMLGVLGVSPRIGRDLLPENDIAGSPAVAILTDATWRSRFGADPSIVGQTTTMDMAPLEIVGVLQRAGVPSDACGSTGVPEARIGGADRGSPPSVWGLGRSSVYVGLPHARSGPRCEQFLDTMESSHGPGRTKPD